jgi:hypothetical protein
MSDEIKYKLIDAVMVAVIIWAIVTVIDIFCK